jgi:RNA polymerase sigma-70 factor, ECF subfamily
MLGALVRSQAMAGEPIAGKVEDDADDHPNEPNVLPLPRHDWGSLVDGVRDGRQEAMESLYAIFSRGIRFFLLRNLGPEEIDDKVHDCFVIVTQAIRNGDLREPDRLMGYVRTVVKRQIAASIDVAVQQRRTRADFEDTLFSVSDWRENPESSIMARQRTEIARKVLQGISRRDRDILHRFYVLEQSQDQICADMGLTYNQFRLLKSRAKARFGEIGRKVAAGAGVNLKKNN